MRRVCDYYDNTTSTRREANNRMLAHYLLGRCYDDMGEAPLALEEFNHAINSAGLTPKETDLGTLGRVHGQKAYLFYKSYMPDNSLLELDKAGSVGPASQTIIVDGIVIDNVELFMESGSHLIVKNGGTLK